jgi:hypothetical protein
MKSKSFVVVIVVAAAVIGGGVDLAEARGFGFRGGASVRIGIGVGGNRPVRYSGPAFYAAPRTNRVYRQDSVQFQQRPWYYSRSGSVEYYRPYNPLYRVR